MASRTWFCSLFSRSCRSLPKKTCHLKVRGKILLKKGRQLSSLKKFLSWRPAHILNKVGYPRNIADSMSFILPMWHAVCLWMSLNFCLISDWIFPNSLLVCRPDIILAFISEWKHLISEASWNFIWKKRCRIISYQQNSVLISNNIIPNRIGGGGAYKQ